VTRCTVLVSTGRNPVTGRPRLPPEEAAAISLAVRGGLEPRLLHAGSPDAALALRRGLGLGSPALDILDVGVRGDPLAALIAHLQGDRPEIILCGARAEAGECSGMVPHRLGAALGRTVITRCLDLSRDGASWIVRTRMSGGTRRVLGLPPCGAVLTLATGAITATLGSRWDADRGTVTAWPVDAPDDPRHARPARPSRRLPPPIAPPRDIAGGGRVLKDAGEGAEAILELLDEIGLR